MEKTKLEAGSREGVSISEQLKFFIPLAMTSILILISHSLFNMALAKLPTPEIYISAFVVAKSLMHLAERPTMMKQTATALVEDSGISILAVDVLKMMVILPLLITIREFYWGILMKKRMTNT